LKELAAWLITTHHITDYKVTSLTHPDGTKVVTITTAASVAVLTDAFKVIEALRNCITWVVEAREGTIREKTKLLGDREQELVNLRRILLAFESSDARHAENVLQTPATPVRGGGGGTGYAVMMSTPGAPHAQSTPTQKPAAGLYSGDLAVTPSGHSTGADNSAARWSGAKSALQHASPAAKQAAKLLSEVLKEVRLLFELSIVAYAVFFMSISTVYHLAATEEQAGDAAGAAQRPAGSPRAAGRGAERVPGHHPEPPGRCAAAICRGAGAQ
jgi:hypothetical protein